MACRTAAAVFNMSYFGKFYLLGADARKAADWLFSADVNRPPGTGPSALLLQSQMEFPGHRDEGQTGGLLFFPGSNHSAAWPSMPCRPPQPRVSPLPPFLLPPSWTPSSFVHRRNAGPQYSEGGTCWHLNPVTPPHYHCAFPAWLPESKIHNA